MSTVLITGVSGFLGRFVTARLVARRFQVAGVSRRPTQIPGVRHYAGDFTDSRFMQAVVAELRPDVLVHLAGVIPGAPGGEIVQYEINLLGTFRLFETIVGLGLDPLVIVTSSSAVYGRPSQLPIHEDHPFNPLTAYAASKAAQELAAIQYYETHRLRTIRVRNFNIVGPGQPDTLVTSELAEQIARAEACGGGVVRVGNLEPRRDYTDVRDAAGAIEGIIQSGEPGQVYNVCSGRSHSVKECADILMQLARVPVSLVTEPARVRANDIMDQVGSAERLQAATGWEPAHGFEASLRDLLEDWRQRLRTQA